MNELRKNIADEIAKSYSKGFIDGVINLQKTIKILKEKGAIDSQIVEVLQCEEIIEDFKKTAK